MSAADDAVKTAMAGLDFKKSGDRLRGAYLRRRADRLQADNASWNANRIATQLTAELAAIQGYLTQKAPLVNNVDTTDPGHIDLRVGAALLTLSQDNGAFGQRFFDALEKEARTNRQTWVSQIVWRAMAIHSDVLWTNLTPPQLHQLALDELLDRRLHAVEMMHFVVNSAGFGHHPRPWKPSGPTGPWFDGFRIRCVEYPWVQPAEPFDSLLQHSADWHRDQSLTAGQLVTEYNYEQPNHIRVHIPPGLQSAWEIDADMTWIRFKLIAGLEPAELIQQMWTPRADYWDRTWMFCDHVGTLLCLKALWFGTRRRTTKNDMFNAVMNRPGYVRIGPFVGDNHNRQLLMADAADDHFENVSVDLDDLQIGDLVRFWNSRIYEMWPPYVGAWGSEFSLVMGVDVDGRTGKVQKPMAGGPQVSLAGHGMHTVLYNVMAAEATDHLRTRWLRAAAIATTASSDSVIHEGHKYVRWTPYESFDGGGPWWVEIPESTWRGEWGYTSQSNVVKGVPRTVANEAGGSGYQPPPDTQAVYFPLFEPAVDQTDADGDSWRVYLRKRKENAAFRLTSTMLHPVAIDGRLAQGLFYRGSTAKIPVVRPRVRL